MSKSPYPSDFLWGASTASHQVEGGTVNQWSEWEKAQAENLAQTAEHRLGWLKSWPRIADQAKRPENYISGAGVNHYSLYKEDFAILQQLGMNSFRFGIEWSRVQPEEGTWDEQAIQHYHSYIQELKNQNIEPILTLWHWTMPTWFTDKGGFEHSQNLKYFDEYVARMVREFGQMVRYVIVLNEPNVYTGLSYLSGEWPPQQRNPTVSARVYWNLAQAHKRAYTLLKQENPELQVGIAAQLGNMQPKRPAHLVDRLTARTSAYANNWWFLNRIRSQLDFIGLNYYFTDYWKGFHKANPDKPLSDLGWYMEPRGLGALLRETHKRYKLPIMITENGLADSEEKWRKWWLQETMTTLEGTLRDGINLIGYLHWSLLDNFEWKYGWWPKFGLVQVDREANMKRTVRSSAVWLKAYIAQQNKP